MITISNSSIIEEIKQRLPIVEAYQRYIGGNLKKDGNRFVDHCFIHSGDSNASFTIHTDTNRYCCYGCNVNGDVVDLVAAYKGIDNKAAIKFLRDDLGIVDAPKQATVPQKAVTYDYKDKDGNLLYQVVRKYKDGKKTFIQRQPDGSGKWSYNLKGIEPIPYKLPELLGAIQRGEAVYIVEGEKDVDSLTAAGLTATCNSGGAGKWKSVYSQYFQSNTRVIILPDNDEPGREHSLQVADALHKRGCLVKIVELPGLPLKGDVTDWLQAGNTVEQLISLVDSAELWKPTGQSEPSPGDEPNKDDEPHKYQEWKDLFKGTSYTVNKNGCLCVLKPDKDNPKINKVVPMANFTARITKEVVKDDGQETKFMFEIDGILVFGKKLSTINVPSTKFNSLCWVVENWGAAANIIPGAATKDSLRHAIQTTGERCKRETIFTHTGWRKIGGSWAYLHGGGAIGAAAVTVDLEEAKLTRYSLPVIAVASESRRAAALTSLECLQLAPEEITLPLLATVYLSPLCEPMRQAGCEPSFLLWLSGMTGARKSTLAGLFLSHYGQFTGKDLPGSFKDTENTLERKAFLLKDTVFCVDDYHPVGSPQEKRRMEKTAHGIIRGYGDRVGRGRMNADTSLKESFVPRGLCIVTGEDVPNLGQSATARLLTLDLKRGDVDLNKLSAMQAKSYLLSECMAGYIDWLRPRISTIAANTK